MLLVKKTKSHSTPEQHTPQNSPIDCSGVQPYHCQTSHISVLVQEISIVNFIVNALKLVTSVLH